MSTEKNNDTKIRTLSEAYPNEEIGTFVQENAKGSFYIPKDIEEVTLRASSDVARLKKLFS